MLTARRKEFGNRGLTALTVHPSSRQHGTSWRAAFAICHLAVLAGCATTREVQLQGLIGVGEGDPINDEAVRRLWKTSDGPAKPLWPTCISLDEEGSPIHVSSEEYQVCWGSRTVATGRAPIRAELACQPQARVVIRPNDMTIPPIRVPLPKPERLYVKSDAQQFASFPEGVTFTKANTKALPPDSMVEVVRHWPASDFEFRPGEPVPSTACTTVIVRVLDAKGAVEQGTLLVGDLQNLTSKRPVARQAQFVKTPTVLVPLDSIVDGDWNGYEVLLPGEQMQVSGPSRWPGWQMASLVAKPERVGLVPVQDLSKTPPVEPNRFIPATGPAYKLDELILAGGSSRGRPLGYGSFGEKRANAWATMGLAEKVGADAVDQHGGIIRTFDVGKDKVMIVGIRKSAIREKTLEEKQKESDDAQQLAARVAKGRCPIGWTQLPKGVCYQIVEVTYRGVVPLIRAQVVTSASLALSLRIGVLEDGEVKCSDSFPLQNLEPGKVSTFTYPCPPTGIINDTSNVRAFIRLEAAY